MSISRAYRALLRAALGLVFAAAPAPGGRANAQEPRSPANNDEASRQAISRALDESYPDRPEWVDMLADILQGSQLGPNDGWFRRAKAQTRFDWGVTRTSLDRDGDGRVSRPEFPGDDADFGRLDRDHDKALTPGDFDFSAHALTPSPGMAVFYRADRDGNGKVTREEFNGLFTQWDGGGQGYLSLTDLQDALRPPQAPASSPKERPTGGGPSKETLVRGLFRQEIGSLQPGPSAGEAAPDFTLQTNDGSRAVTLSKLVGPKPVVLVFGNFTCGPFRSQAGDIEKLHAMYKDRATFVMVYVREAHPTDGWSMDSNDRVGVALAQPKTYDERVAVAQTCGERLGLGFPMLVDSIDDSVGARYSGMPSRLYLIDAEGKVAYKSGRGPFGFKPAELEHSLVLLLQHEATSGSPHRGDKPPAPPARDATGGPAAR